MFANPLPGLLWLVLISSFESGSCHELDESNSVFELGNIYPRTVEASARDMFLDNLVANMTIPEMGQY